MNWKTPAETDELNGAEDVFPDGDNPSDVQLGPLRRSAYFESFNTMRRDRERERMANWEKRETNGSPGSRICLIGINFRTRGRGEEEEEEEEEEIIGSAELVGPNSNRRGTTATTKFVPHTSSSPPF
ncbi:hypothetical protein RUM43_010021 [Polyplax serrata]|uniref:Uncharacterized protein n=1 Tax=Polyplax serrata TaxID=468196 RepID=A0AAN8PVB3_POLSC